MSDSARMRAAAVVAVVEETVLRPKTLRVVPSLATLDAEQRQQLANRRAAQVFTIVRESTVPTQLDAAILTGDCQRTLGNWERGSVDLRALRAFVQLLEIRAAQRARGGK